METIQVGMPGLRAGGCILWLGRYQMLMTHAKTPDRLVQWQFDAQLLNPKPMSVLGLKTHFPQDSNAVV